MRKLRKSSIERKTKETQIKIDLNLDGVGNSQIKTPVNFLNHMLEAFAKYGLFDIKLEAKGDMEVDQHHTVEDVGIVLGLAFKDALGDKKGIGRAGYFVFPMDESLAVVSIDIGGRPYLQFDAKFKRRYCGDFDTDLLEDFFYGFTANLGANAAVRMPYGRSDHHKIEAAFKGFAKAMKMACSIERRAAGKIPSTKGSI